MKKTIMAIIMLLCLCGCANKYQSLPEKDPAPTVQQTIQSEEKDTGSTPEKQEEGSSLPAASGTDVKKEQPVKTGESKKAESGKTTKGSNTSSVKPETKSDTEPANVSAPAPTSKPTASTTSTSKPKPASTSETAPTPASKQKPTSTPAPTPKPTPAPTPTPEAQVDIAYWVSYAKSYAGSLGLKLDGSAVDCWDNPITASSKSTCLQRDISSRLNRYAADSDITDVWIWSESIGNGSYNIYIGYA